MSVSGQGWNFGSALAPVRDILLDHLCLLCAEGRVQDVLVAICADAWHDVAGWPESQSSRGGELSASQANEASNNKLDDCGRAVSRSSIFRKV